MILLNGKSLANEIKDNLKEEISSYHRKIGLAVVLVGEDQASHLYVSMKKKSY
jgi:methylenetetrahydrofolate dehydrogenase (NADP+)/methenyltetrahydrofolate cyclohydrolase